MARQLRSPDSRRAPAGRSRTTRIAAVAAAPVVVDGDSKTVISYQIETVTERPGVHPGLSLSGLLCSIIWRIKIPSATNFVNRFIKIAVVVPWETSFVFHLFHGSPASIS